jgi:hypothetical protein
MLKFLNGILMGTTSQAGAANDPAVGAGAGGGASASASGAAAAGSNAGAAGAGAAATPWSFPTEKPFAEYLPEKYRADASLRDIKDFDGLVGGYINAQKMIGVDPKRRLTLPAASDDAKGWNDLYTALGRPEKIDGYLVPPKGDKAAYSESDLAFQKQILPVLHEAGLSQHQLEAIIPKWNALQDAALGAQNEAAAKGIQEADAALSKEWGAAKDQKLALAKTTLEYFADTLKLGDGLKQALERPGPDGKPLGNDPAFARLFAHLGQQMQEDGLLGKGGPQGQGFLSPAEAQQQIAHLMGGGDAAFMKAYRTKDHPGHADAVARMKTLYEQAHPAEPNG